MPSIRQNLQKWNKTYDWSGGGEEWSSLWGGSESQWYRTIFPRIKEFLPTDTILEIGPGFGRWTHYLKDHCSHLIVVDLAEICIRACRERFASTTNIDCHTNDGTSLGMIPNGSVDFIFSFDSLVHAESNVMQAYIREFRRTLKPHGVGFIHHSNLGEYRERFLPWHRIITDSGFSSAFKLPSAVRQFFQKTLGWSISTHSRAATMTARLFEDYCSQYELQCLRQELINWGRRNEMLIDSLSVFTTKETAQGRINTILRNPNFTNETGAFTGELSIPIIE